MEQPATQRQSAGRNVTFVAKATGAGPIAYQWRKNGVTINGSTDVVLSLVNVAAGDSGRYDVVATNTTGSATSTGAQLTVVAASGVTVVGSPRRIVRPGDALQLSVTVSNVGTPSYQWVHNGRPVAGATTSTLAKPSAGYADSGWYTLVATDDQGPLRSPPFFVFVVPRVVQLLSWGNFTSTFGLQPDTGLGAVAVGGGPSLVREDGTVQVLNGGTISRFPTGINDVVAATYAAFNNTILHADATVGAFYDGKTQTVSQPPGANEIVKISGGPDYLLYGLNSNGVFVQSAWYGSVPAGTDHIADFATGDHHVLLVHDDGTVSAYGYNYAGEATVPAGLNDVIAVAAGYEHSLALKSDGTVIAWGNNDYGQSTVPAGLGGVTAIAASTYFSLALKSDGTLAAWGRSSNQETAIPAGATSVFAIGTYGGTPIVLRDATADVIAITKQPTDQSASASQNVTFSVGATGGQPLSYQWRKNGAAIPGATLSDLTLPELAPADAASYDVVVTNFTGSVTSSAAKLTVSSNFAIVSPTPRRQYFTAGQTLDLVAGVSDGAAATYQWTHDGRPIPGATSSRLTRRIYSRLDAGRYVAEVSRGSAATRTSPVFVFVEGPAPATKLISLFPDGTVPAPVTRTDLVALDCRNHAMALRSDGRPAAWGSMVFGEASTVLYDFHDLVGVCTCFGISFVLNRDGTVGRWGNVLDPRAQLPNNLNEVVMLASGEYMLALRSDGTVVEWGGIVPLQPPADLSDVVAVAQTGSVSYAVRGDGSVTTWGITDPVMTPPGDLNRVSSIAAATNAVAVRTDGTVVAWGPDFTGINAVPTGLNHVLRVAVAANYAVALKDDGTLVAWGRDAKTLPIPAGINNVIDVSGGLSTGAILQSAPVVTDSPVDQMLSPGGPLNLQVAAFGAGPFTYQWRKNGVAIAGATNAAFGLAQAAGRDAGSYDVVVTNSIGSTTTLPAKITGPLSEAGRLINLSIRCQARDGADRLIVGLVIGGSDTAGTKPLLVRAVGPTLAAFGLSGALADPALETYDSTGVRTGGNDDWAGGFDFGQVGAFGFAGSSPKDAAIYNPAARGGAETVHVIQKSGDHGIVLAEVYDATPGATFTTDTPRLINGSARTFAGTGDDVLILGFVVGGNRPLRLLVRAVGPTLGLPPFSIAGVLADPRLEIHDQSGVIATNDNWGDNGASSDLATVFSSVGAFGLSSPTSLDAALVVTVQPGIYSAVVHGAGDTTGIAIVEVYELP